MQTFQWEQRDPQTPLWLHMIAGSCAGLIEHLSLLPLDNIKTHCQAGSHLRQTQIVRKIYNNGGFYNFFSGSSILVLGCIPAHAIYFAIYQYGKKKIQYNQSNHYLYAFLGATSCLFHDLVMNPTQVVKQRLQLFRSRTHGVRTIQVISNIYKNQGLISFYRSFGINFLMNIPFHSMTVYMNEKLKHILKVKDGDNNIKFYICGGIAGGIASIPTCPFDTIKTKLNTQQCMNNFCEKKHLCNILNQKKIEYHQSGNHQKIIKFSLYTQKEPSIKYRNIFDTSFTIFKEEGVLGFFTGLKMRIGIQSLSAGIGWGTYQSIKKLLNNKITYH